MKQLTIHIRDDKFQSVVDLLSNLGFVKIDKPKSRDNFITEEQIADSEEEFKKMQEIPGYALNWDDAKHLIRVD